MKKFNLVLKGKRESLEKIIRYCNYRFVFEKSRFLLSNLIEIILIEIRMISMEIFRMKM